MTARATLERRVRSGGARCAAAFVAIVATTAIAQAHITVRPASAPGGTVVVLTFRVPNERARTDTTRVALALPRDTAIATVSVVPEPGWRFAVAGRRPVLAAAAVAAAQPETITWYGGAIKPHASHAFRVRIGPLPARPGPLYFKAIQTYANGEVVRWIDLPEAGEDEPSEPAPVLLITAPLRSGR
jgi:uncharacterized protein